MTLGTLVLGAAIAFTAAGGVWLVAIIRASHRSRS
jgi:hypothetical protein